MLQYVVPAGNRLRETSPSEPAPPSPELSAPEPARSAPERASAPETATAKPSAGRAVVGGVEYAVGGWGAYEIGRRRERWAASGPASGRPGDMYGGRSYVHAEDAALSVLGASRATVGGAAGLRPLKPRASALQKAARRLADVLARVEDRLCDSDSDGVWECAPPSALSAELRPKSHARGEVAERGAQVARGAAPALVLTIPSVTSADLRAFADDPAQQDDPEDLEDLGDGVLSLVATIGARAGAALPAMPSLAARGRPPLPARAVPVTDDEAVLRLEASVAPYVASVELMQAALASRLDAAAAAIEGALEGAPASGGGSLGPPAKEEGGPR